MCQQGTGEGPLHLLQGGGHTPCARPPSPRPASWLLSSCVSSLLSWHSGRGQHRQEGPGSPLPSCWEVSLPLEVPSVLLGPEHCTQRLPLRS